jgi:hypothetical protein
MNWKGRRKDNNLKNAWFGDEEKEIEDCKIEFEQMDGESERENEKEGK